MSHLNVSTFSVTNSPNSRLIETLLFGTKCDSDLSLKSLKWFYFVSIKLGKPIKFCREKLIIDLHINNN